MNIIPYFMLPFLASNIVHVHSIRTINFHKIVNYDNTSTSLQAAITNAINDANGTNLYDRDLCQHIVENMDGKAWNCIFGLGSFWISAENEADGAALFSMNGVLWLVFRGEQSDAEAARADLTQAKSAKAKVDTELKTCSTQKASIETDKNGINTKLGVCNTEKAKIESAKDEVENDLKKCSTQKASIETDKNGINAKLDTCYTDKLKMESAKEGVDKELEFCILDLGYYVAQDALLQTVDTKFSVKVGVTLGVNGNVKAD